MIKKVIKKLISVVMIFSLCTCSFASTNIDEKAVEEVLIEAFDTIKSLDIEKIKNNYYDENSEKYIKVVESFFTSFPEAKSMGEFILGEIDYEVKDVDSEPEKITVKVDFSMPNFPKIIKRILPKILFKNFFSLFNQKISEKNIMYIIECLYTEVVNEKSDSEKYKKMNVSYDFVFKKIAGSWCIANVNDIEEKIMEIFKGITNK